MFATHTYWATCPPSYPLVIPYYPPNSFDPTPDQFRPRRVMPAIPRRCKRNPSDSCPFFITPKAHSPPVVQTPVVPASHCISATFKIKAETCYGAPPVILPPLQAAMAARLRSKLHLHTHEGSPIRPPIVQRPRKAD
ncbi:hypothetical protein BS47DRAFT_263193 [Hydnum rufescens UP504]|uniref:Uncharacterized protein n=1 Tax=Hydnum rufescens UP504 TaxID=1448309 RepID=A0A9P6E1I0_9AGAM|nr:hypothetical protein BS47DRAFT_263193 [Hydnum rufescens UP504]